MVKAGSELDPEPISQPRWFLAELTYRCPLACSYCSNPLDYERYADELSTDQWKSALDEARKLGAIQLCFSGGEPLLRKDLEELSAHARGLGFYSQVSTSGVGLNEARLAGLRDAGLDHMQLSFQAATADVNDYIGGAKTFELKKRTARLIKQYGFSMLLNVVVHRHNVDQVDRILDMAEELEADYVELANCQYHAWAHRNRDQLMPTQEQLERAEEATNAFRARVGERISVYFVVPDYYSDRPKKCMGGWGAVFIVVAPDGTVLPCHDARHLPGIDFPNVRDADLAWIWRESPAFNRFRGVDWMKEPCRSCPEKHQDLGGCRCQAYMLTGDPANTDPACALSPEHHKVVEAIQTARHAQIVRPPLVFRDNRKPRVPPGISV